MTLVQANAVATALGYGLDEKGAICRISDWGGSRDVIAEWTGSAWGEIFSAPIAHASSHEEGGSDELEISIAQIPELGTPTAFGLARLEDVDPAEARTALELGTAALSDTGDFATPAQLAAHEADTTAIHGIADTSLLLDTSDIGVSVQSQNANLQAEAGLSGAADKVSYYTGATTKALADFPEYGRNFLANRALKSFEDAGHFLGGGLFKNGQFSMFSPAPENFNWSLFTIDRANADKCMGSASYTGVQITKILDNPIYVNPYGKYQLGLSIKQTVAINSDDSVQHYVGVSNYDIDGLPILPRHSVFIGGSAKTTLAADLDNGDTTIQLTDATGWYSSTLAYQRCIAFFNYVSATGLIYPAHTYSRNVLYDAWASGGISGNTITLSTPYVGATIPAGTPVGNMKGGSFYEYLGWSPGKAYLNVWTRKTGTIGGTPDAAVGADQTFRHGVAYIKFLLLCNYNYYAHDAGGVLPTTSVFEAKYSNLTFERVL